MTEPPKTSRLAIARRAALRLVFLLACVYLALCLVATVLQRTLTYFPDPLSAQDEADVAASAFEEVRIPTGDGLSLHAVFRPPPEGGRVLLFLHGNAGNLASRLPLLEELTALGAGGLLPDYRGFGKSPGRPSEAGLYEDASSAMAWLAGRGVPPGRVVLFGKSLGTGVAVEMAVSHPAAGLVLESPYTSLPDAGQRHFPILPVGWLLRDRFDSLSKAAAVRVPLLAIWSTGDRIVAPDLSERLFAAFPGPKTKLVVEGAGHNDIRSAAGKEYMDAWRAYLEALP